MIRITARRNLSLDLGRRGENLAREIIFDISDWQSEYGVGTVSLIAQRQDDISPYPCTTSVDGSTVIWPITAADTSWHGYHDKCELQYRVDDVLVKSSIWRTYVSEALGTPSEEAPEPHKDWVNQVLKAEANAENAAERAESAAIHQPYPNMETGTWWVWDYDKGEYVNSEAVLELTLIIFP